MRKSAPNRRLKNLAIVVVTASASILMWGGNASAATTDDAFNELLAFNPGVSASDLAASMREAARETGQTYDQVVTQALAESRKHEPAGFAVGSSCNKVSLTAGYLGGNVIYSPSSTAGIQHGHAGVYATATLIVEAPAHGENSGTFPVKNRQYCSGLRKMTVDISVTDSKRVGEYAQGYLTGKPYNYNFSWNKGGNIDSLNCSELVWKAFKREIDLDLDSDGGLGVYPKDIANSSHTHTYETING